MHGAAHTVLETIFHRAKGAIMKTASNLKPLLRGASKLIGKLALSTAISAVTTI